MKRSVMKRFAAASMFLAMCLFGVASQSAEPGNAAARSVRFYRILAPEDRMKEWPVEGERYLPMDEKEFTQLTSQVKSHSADAPVAAIAAARYAAKLVGEHLAGTASFDVVGQIKHPTPISLGDCRLAVHAASWNAAADQKNAKGNAAAGLNIGLNNEGQLVAMVEHAGRMDVEWTLAGRHDANDALVFPVSLARSPANEFVVDLPAGFSPSVDRGLILGSEPADKGCRRWRIELGGRNRFLLRVNSDAAAHQRRQLPLLQEQRTYDCSLRGVELSVQWKIQSPGEPIRQLSVLLDPGLQLVSARLGNTPISWAVQQSGGNDAVGKRVTLELPESIGATRRTVRLGAIGRPTLGRPWRLPRIRLGDATWQEGNISILLPEPLVTNRIAATGCSQTGLSPLAAPRAGQAMLFQAFDPDATVEVLFSRRPTRMQATCASDIELDGEEATAHVTAEFNITEESQFDIEADVARHWVIDSVETTSVGGIADWSVDPSDRNLSRLSIRLASAILPTRSARVSIVARRLFSPSDGRLGAGDLMPIHFHGITRSKRWVAVQATGPYALRVHGDERLQRLKVEDLEPNERSLFADVPQRLLFEYGPHSASVAVSLTARKVKFTSSVRVDVAVGPRIVREDYRFHYVPQAGHVDRATIRFSSHREASPHWSVVGDGVRLKSARRWTDAELALAGVDKNMETWDVTLRQPVDGPFDVLASRETSRKTASSVALASMPKADSQQGVVSVRSVDGEMFQLENSRLKPVTPQPALEDRPQTIRGEFEFDPAYETAKDAPPALLLNAASGTASPSAWIAEVRVESWQQAGGETSYSAVYDLQSFGRRLLRLTMPPRVTGKDINAVTIDGRPAVWRVEAVVSKSKASTAQRVKTPAVVVAVEVPADCRRVRVGVEWTALNARLGAFGKLVFEMPSPDAPVLAKRWTAWLPPNYDGIDGAAVNKPRSETPLYAGWSARRCESCCDGSDSLHYVSKDSAQLCGVGLLFFAIASLWWIFRIRAASVKTHDSDASTTVSAGPLVGTPAGTSAGTSVGSQVAAGAASPLVVLLAVLALAADGRLALADQPESSKPAISSRARANAAEAAKPSVLRNAPGAATAAEKVEKNASPAYRVFVPVDAKRNPVGGKVYVPEPFYQELHRRVAPAEKTPSWLITSALYRGELSREPVSGRWTVNMLRARYKIRVTESSAAVRIPLSSAGVNLMPGGVLVDGRPIDSEWDASGASLAISVEEPGEYRVEILLRPTIRISSGTSGFEIAVPRVAKAKLELALPPDAPTIETPTALGESRLDTEPMQWTAELGPTDRVAVRWLESALAGESRASIEAEELLWLNVQPGAVSVTARFKLHALEGPFQQVRLAVDPSLKLLPGAGDNPPTASQSPLPAKSDPNPSRIITFHWPRPISDQTTLEANFLLSGVSAVGNIRLPSIELLDVQPGKRWLAVSVAPTLDYDEQQNDRDSSPFESAAVSDFLKSWGTTSSTPQEAYRLPEDAGTWTLATRPREAQLTADQTLRLSFDEGRIDMAFDAHVSATSGNVFQYRIAVPQGFQAERVAVTESNVDCVDHWSQNAEGITVFLKNPAADSQSLSLRGRLPVRMGEKRRLPSVTLRKCEIRTATTQIVERPTVVVTLDNRPLASTTPNPDGPHVDGQIIAWNGSQPPTMLFLVKPNREASASSKAKTIPWPKPNERVRRPKAKDSAAESGEVRLAEVLLLRQSADNWTLAAAFEVSPNGEESLDVHLPAGCTLLQATVANMPVTPKKTGGDVWRLPTADWNSLQRVEVLCRTAAPTVNSKGRLCFEAPTLNGWPAKRTVWTVFTPDNWTVGDPQNAIASSEEQTAAKLAASRSGDHAAERGLSETLRQTIAADHIAWSYVSENDAGVIALRVSASSQWPSNWLIAAAVAAAAIVLLAAAAVRYSSPRPGGATASN